MQLLAKFKKELEGSGMADPPDPTCWVVGPDAQVAIPVRLSIGTTVGQLEHAKCKLTNWAPSHGEVVSTTSQMPIATHELLQSEQRIIVLDPYHRIQA